jgi:hypothetical protein
MLARRFTIVCLICMLFGMVLSDIVIGVSRPAYSDAGLSSNRCIGDKTTRCSFKIAD